MKRLAFILIAAVILLTGCSIGGTGNSASYHQQAARAAARPESSDSDILPQRPPQQRSVAKAGGYGIYQHLRIRRYQYMERRD